MFCIDATTTNNEFMAEIVDFHKASDTIDPEVLKKLDKHGFGKTFQEMLRSYLKDRFQNVNSHAFHSYR